MKNKNRKDTFSKFTFSKLNFDIKSWKKLDILLYILRNIRTADKWCTDCFIVSKGWMTLIKLLWEIYELYIDAIIHADLKYSLLFSLFFFLSSIRIYLK